MASEYKPLVTAVGGGMITQIQLLPTLYHLQRTGRLGAISCCALDAGPLKAMMDDPSLVKGFPGQSFVPYPDPARVSSKDRFPELFKRRRRQDRQPDSLHSKNK